jgi:adenylate cyclase
LDRAYELAQKAVQLDANLPQAHAQLGWVLMFKRRHDAAIAEYERAFSLNPNFTDYGFGLSLIFSGEATRAIKVFEQICVSIPFKA